MENELQREAILPLPPDVQAQVQSSITITSLNDVVCELVKNSLDAGATRINISVDPGRGATEVEDNGMGIPATDFALDGGLGKHFRMLHKC